MANKNYHPVPLWGLFMALLALTAAEVALFEVWSRNQWLMPKYAMVILLLVFTLPKAAIVLIFFMHLKFERQLIVALALLPFVMAIVAVLPILTDIVTLKSQSYNQVPGLREFVPSAEGHHELDTDTDDDHGH
jgi:cytochrome c oxidase subunit IV